MTTGHPPSGGSGGSDQERAHRRISVAKISHCQQRHGQYHPERHRNPPIQREVSLARLHDLHSAANRRKYGHAILPLPPSCPGPDHAAAIDRAVSGVGLTRGNAAVCARTRMGLFAIRWIVERGIGSWEESSATACAAARGFQWRGTAGLGPGPAFRFICKPRAKTGRRDPYKRYTSGAETVKPSQ